MLKKKQIKAREGGVNLKWYLILHKLKKIKFYITNNKTECNTTKQCYAKQFHEIQNEPAIICKDV